MIQTTFNLDLLVSWMKTAAAFSSETSLFSLLRWSRLGDWELIYSFTAVPATPWLHLEDSGRAIWRYVESYGPEQSERYRVQVGGFDGTSRPGAGDYVFETGGERLRLAETTPYRIDPGSMNVNISVKASGLSEAKAFSRAMLDALNRHDVLRGRAYGPPVREVSALVRKGAALLNELKEQGPGIVNVPGLPARPVATVGYDDPTGDDIAADVRRK